MTFNNGQKYSGTFKQGVFNDFGRLEKEDEKFEGYFKRGQKDYIGKVYSQDKVKYGLWKGGDFVKWISEKEYSKLETEIETWRQNSPNSSPRSSLI